MAHYARALITGASSGIGEAFAAELAGTTDLLLTGRNEEQLNTVRDGVSRPGRTVATAIADLSQAGALDALIAQADAFAIDLLINNAGLGHVGRFLDSPAEIERQTTLVNVTAVTALTRGLLPGMLERARAAQRRCGLIIVASTAAFAPVPFFATYAATKAFDLSFAEALADELRGEPIDIVALCPGATRTRFGARAGFDLGNVPGAADPRTVARDGLRALGRQTVAVSGLLNQATLGPAIAPRRIATGAIGLAMRALLLRRCRP
jgi:short-subunit dehydrogenase